STPFPANGSRSHAGQCPRDELYRLESTRCHAASTGLNSFQGARSADRGGRDTDPALAPEREPRNGKSPPSVAKAGAVSRPRRQLLHEINKVQRSLDGTQLISRGPLSRSGGT